MLTGSHLILTSSSEVLTQLATQHALRQNLALRIHLHLLPIAPLIVAYMAEVSERSLADGKHVITL